MPTVIVNRDKLFAHIGESFTDEKFDEICFEFGIELDEITSEREIFQNEQKKENKDLSSDVLYKIEVPANRYDLLCLEGLAMSLRVFLGKSKIPKYTLSPSKEELIVDKSVLNIRPFGLAAILRNISFTEESLIGFMELQDKLHQNICRGRTLVSMGTHDLDTVKGPFHYRTYHRDSFEFVPLNRTEKFTGTSLLSHLAADPKLKHYVPLLANEEYLPVFLDSNGVVMSLPPLINSEHSKLKISTKNVIIDITAKDLTKASIVLNTLVTMFSIYCASPFSVESVKVVSPDGKYSDYPKLEPRLFNTDKSYLNRIAGLDLSVEEMSSLLLRMGLNSTHEGDQIKVEAPVTRSDILHACDIAEDLAISFGYNNIVKRKLTTVCNGTQQPINKLTDLIRLEMSMSGYIECLTMALMSTEDVFTNMLEEATKEKLSNAVQIFKSKCPEFQVFRTSLIPCILKTIEANKANQVILVNLSYLIKSLKFQMLSL
jgi:phenylalanyl-tRNA synthetase beta chain